LKLPQLSVTNKTAQ